MVRITWEFLADSQGITGCFADKQVVIICSLSDQALYPGSDVMVPIADGSEAKITW